MLALEATAGISYTARILLRKLAEKFPRVWCI